MFDDSLDFERRRADAFSEFDHGELEEWDSLKDLLADLDDHGHEQVPSGSFGIPALLGDGDGIARWTLRLSHIRCLTDITRLLQRLPEAPWCIAARVFAIDSDGMRVGVTTTRHVSQDQFSETIENLLGEARGLCVEIQAVVPQVTGAKS